MTGILVIERPTKDITNLVDNGIFDFNKGLPKTSINMDNENKTKLGISVHPLSRALEFGDGKINKDVSPSLRATDWKSPHCVWEQDPKSCAIRGRGPLGKTKQQLEIGDDVANALTSVSKDSLVLDPTIICLMPWNNPGGDVGDVSPSITTSAWQHNNFVKLPADGSPMVMADPRKNYGRMQPSAESSPTLLSTDYKSPHLVMKNQIPKEVEKTAENLRAIASESRGEELGMTINPDMSLRPHKLNKAKDGVSEYCTDYDGSVGSTNIAARPNNVYGETTRYRIRKLTPRECYRLMDVPEQQIDRLLASGISKSQHYKLAGNSIVVSCLYHIFKNLFTNEIPNGQQLSLF